MKRIYSLKIYPDNIKMDENKIVFSLQSHIASL